VQEAFFGGDESLAQPAIIAKQKNTAAAKWRSVQGKHMAVASGRRNLVGENLAESPQFVQPNLRPSRVAS
jgi:hypothetical protein